jgi:excisionase family DNA binding protein
MESLNEFVSTREASERFGLSQTHLGHLARNQLIGARKMGGYWLIHLPSLEAYLASNPRPGLKPGAKLKRRPRKTS